MFTILVFFCFVYCEAMISVDSDFLFGVCTHCFKNDSFLKPNKSSSVLHFYSSSLILLSFCFHKHWGIIMFGTFNIGSVKFQHDQRSDEQVLEGQKRNPLQGTIYNR